jgi:hypothetical protein
MSHLTSSPLNSSVWLSLKRKVIFFVWSPTTLQLKKLSLMYAINLILQVVPPVTCIRLSPQPFLTLGLLSSLTPEGTGKDQHLSPFTLFRRSGLQGPYTAATRPPGASPCQARGPSRAGTGTARCTTRAPTSKQPPHLPLCPACPAQPAYHSSALGGLAVPRMHLHQ